MSKEHLNYASGSTLKLSVVIPAYNESKNIGEAVIRVREALSNIHHEIIVVDDGSVDGTFQIASRQGVVVVRHERNRGKGAAFRTGVGLATGNITLQIDADLQFLPSEIPTLIGPIVRGQADIALATRFRSGAGVEPGSVSLRNRLGNFAASLMTSFASLRRITDIQAGFKAFKTAAIKDLDFRQDGFSYEPEIVILASRRGSRIIEVPITYVKRRHGSSKINFLHDAYQISKTIAATLFRRDV